MRTAQAALAGTCILMLSACGNSGDSGAGGTGVAPRSASVSTVTAPGAGGGTSSTSTAPGAPSSGAQGSGATSGASGPTAQAPVDASASTPGASGADTSGSAAASGTGAAPASASAGTQGGHAYTAASWSQFTSPAGKNWCDMNSGTVGCRLSPSLSAQHDGANYVLLTPQGVRFLAGDPGMDTNGSAERWATSLRGVPMTTKDGYPVLSYGSSITSQGTTCMSSPDGFSCHNTIAGFDVNSRSVTLTGQRAPA